VNVFIDKESINYLRFFFSFSAISSAPIASIYATIFWLLLSSSKRCITQKLMEFLQGGDLMPYHKFRGSAVFPAVERDGFFTVYSQLYKFVTSQPEFVP
jgi:hypothetical protein